ncbi:MAG: hypothetical protein IKL52_01710 [Candidatus Gastranaerophilales bacterium]|nr:hypothetical protein [Candidatus Gastranaerophilales bacterium]
MAPFPEAEIMTIKRLEVALRKMDYKLLKDGAYKLHEKFHSGHRFEYIDLLKEIFWEVTENEQIPSDVKDILCPTIEDILIESGVDLAHDAYEREEQNEQNRVSSLTSLSYTTPEQEPTQISQEYQYHPQQELQDEIQEKIMNEYIEEVNNIEMGLKQENQEREGRSNAFDAFGSQKQEQTPTRYFANSPFSAEPFKEFNHAPVSIEPTLPVYEVTSEPTFEPAQEYTQEPSQEAIYHEPLYREPSEEPTLVAEQALNENYYQEPTFVVEEITYQEPSEVVTEAVYEQQSEITTEPVYQEQYQEVYQEPTQQEITYQEEINEVTEQTIEEVTEVAQVVEEEKSNPTMAIFYGQDSSEDKINNINELRSAIAEEASAKKVMELISQTTLQADTNVIELQGVLEQLKNKNYENVNLITNSQSAMFTQLFSASEITYDLFEEDNNINFQPLYGLSNLFVCADCAEKYLDEKVGIKPLVLQCPKCKKTMYPEFYAPQEGAKVNLEYYNSALVSLANSEVWLLIHPSFNDKTSSDLIESAFRVSKAVKEVYILDKDINVRETYKYIFSKINPDVKVNIQSSALEDYLSII